MTKKSLLCWFLSPVTTILKESSVRNGLFAVLLYRIFNIVFVEPFRVLPVFNATLRQVKF